MSNKDVPQKGMYAVKPRLSATEFNDAQQKLNECMSIALSNLTQEQVEDVKKTCTELMAMNPTLIMRPDNMSWVRDKMFSDKTSLTYFSRLHYLFFTATGNDSIFIDRVCQNIIDGLALDGNDAGYSLVPAEIAETLPRNVYTYKQGILFGFFAGLASGGNPAATRLFLTLRNNTWLVMVLLMVTLNTQQPASN
jgi:lipoprotein signal peptidase